jgi:hypothetical protein
LINRPDVWGGYNALADRGKPYTRKDGSTGTVTAVATRPAPGNRGKVLLSVERLARHFCRRSIAEIIGLHSTSPANMCKWTALDLDTHGAVTTPAGVNLKAALAWHARLQQLGFTPLLVDSNGLGGFHLWAILSSPIPTDLAWAFARWLVQDFATYGRTAPPETFPKQPCVAPDGYGNWIRLPGRHHTIDHVGKVWDGVRWLDLAAAAPFITSIKGADPKVIPIEVKPPPPRAPQEPRTDVPPPDPFLGRRIQAYLAALPNLAEGQGRHDVAFGFACWLVRDLNLNDETALLWLLRWDAKNTPPRGEEHLRETIAGAHQYGRSPYGNGLTKPIRPYVYPTRRPGHFIIRTRSRSS